MKSFTHKPCLDVYVCIYIIVSYYTLTIFSILYITLSNANCVEIVIHYIIKYKLNYINLIFNFRV